MKNIIIFLNKEPFGEKNRAKKKALKRYNDYNITEPQGQAFFEFFYISVSLDKNKAI